MELRFIIFITLSIITSWSDAQPGKCDQTPPQAKVKTPSENNGVFTMTLDTKDNSSLNQYLPDQTYVLKLSTNDMNRPFRSFMITAEDPEVDNNINYDHSVVDVGSLKTLSSDHGSRYSERCYNTIENTDFSDKYWVEIHWVSPKHNSKENQPVRLRAMIAENDEAWYIGENLTKTLQKDNNKLIDSPPYEAKDQCQLCSEARYEVTFRGKWSRMTHPLHYPSKPDENGYSHMIGASHAFHYTLWEMGAQASAGLKLLAEDANVTAIERDIIEAMSVDNGTRTLIKGRKNFHPHMSEPSYAMFRVDRVHHLFSLAVAMRPSPDWFLGTSKFELCTDKGWLETHEIPLYPWDAGTMDGISYESPKTPQTSDSIGNIERVAVGSFNPQSPFYQKNLNDLPPFAYLKVNLLDVFDTTDDDCYQESRMEDMGDEETKRNEDEKQPGTEQQNQEEPVVEEYRSHTNIHGDDCNLSDWSPWSPCIPDDGYCGVGVQTRQRYTNDNNIYFESYKDSQHSQTKHSSCQEIGEADMVQSKWCYLSC